MLLFKPMKACVRCGSTFYDAGQAAVCSCRMERVGMPASLAASLQPCCGYCANKFAILWRLKQDATREQLLHEAIFFDNKGYRPWTGWSAPTGLMKVTK
jgi:hypothetical protein